MADELHLLALERRIEADLACGRGAEVAASVPAESRPRVRASAREARIDQAIGEQRKPEPSTPGDPVPAP